MVINVETYIAISLMFAVFAAVAAVGTSVVLGVGFERLRAGFDHIRRQSGFFADAIHKLDQRTERLDEETAKLKSGLYVMGERMERTEKTHSFLADAINGIEHRILSGSPSQTIAPEKPKMHTDQVQTITVHQRTQRPQANVRMESWIAQPVKEQTLNAPMPQQLEAPAPQEPSITSLIGRYFMSEGSGAAKGVVYH